MKAYIIVTAALYLLGAGMQWQKNEFVVGCVYIALAAWGFWILLS